MKEMSVYNQLISAPDTCFSTLKREIGFKTSCIPFAVKLIQSLKTLNIKTDYDGYNAANVLLSGLQTLSQGGIIAEDYDKVDFVKRGNTIVPSARVEAFYRAAARKGYRITDTIIAVPQEDDATTYFKENFSDGDIVYTLEDKRINPDRAVNASRLAGRYFSKFICRLDIHDMKTNKRIVMTVCEMPIDDMLEVASVSEQGLYKSKWEEYINDYGSKKKRKVITDELNSETFWAKWTGEMANKTIIRRALKRIKEVLPELTESIYAFEQDSFSEEEKEDVTPVIEIPMEEEMVDLKNLTAEQKNDYKEMYELFRANPKLAKEKTGEIKSMIDAGIPIQKIINKEYASICAIKLNTKLWTVIGGYFDESDKN